MFPDNAKNPQFNDGTVKEVAFIGNEFRKPTRDPQLLSDMMDAEKCMVCIFRTDINVS